MGGGVTGGTERHYLPLAVLVHANINILSLNIHIGSTLTRDIMQAIYDTVSDDVYKLVCRC